MDIRLNLRCIAEMKEAFRVFCRGLGVAPSDCIREFIREVISLGYVPAEFLDMSVLNEVASVHKDVRVYVRVSEEERNRFQDICGDVSMSDVLRNYMMRCLMQGKSAEK